MLDPLRLSRRYHNSGSLTPAVISSFRKAVRDHYRDNPRPMPWRETADPYAILVSEVMLQQTQVERVRVKFAEFMAAFPDITSLAAAPLEHVLLLWQGLGYNRRALALKRCAEEILSRYGGIFPCSSSELQTLPGIGPYTARAIAAFAFGSGEPLIETNIRTVFIHFFFHGRDRVSDREIMPLVAATLDRDNPREWYYALMDVGVQLKRLHRNPGRRSRHHVRQSPFEGSNRQLRSRLLQIVMQGKAVQAPGLAALLGADPEHVEKNLADLEREGFLVRTSSGYLLSDGTKKG